VNLTGQNFSALHDAKGRHDVYRMMMIGFSSETPNSPCAGLAQKDVS
jgi:hypothetical protein